MYQPSTLQIHLQQQFHTTEQILLRCFWKRAQVHLRTFAKQNCRVLSIRIKVSKKNEDNEPDISRKKASPLETSATQLSKLSNFVNIEKQIPVPLEKSLEPKPPQLQLEIQEYELMIRNEKISRCKCCLNEFHRKNPNYAPS